MKMKSFINNIANTDKAAYEKYVKLMKLFNLIDCDLRQVQVLKACFIQKDGTVDFLPIKKFEDSCRA